MVWSPRARRSEEESFTRLESSPKPNAITTPRLHQVVYPCPETTPSSEADGANVVAHLNFVMPENASRRMGSAALADPDLYKPPLPPRKRKLYVYSII
jgi:hypothetical protein